MKFEKQVKLITLVASWSLLLFGIWNMLYAAVLMLGFERKNSKAAKRFKENNLAIAKELEQMLRESGHKQTVKENEELEQLIAQLRS